MTRDDDASHRSDASAGGRVPESHAVITSLDDPRLLPLRGPAPRGDAARTPDSPVVVEGELPVRRLLESGRRPSAVALTRAHAVALADVLPHDVPRFVGSQDDLAQLAGLPFHRGCLAWLPRGSLGTPCDESLLTRLASREHLLVVLAEGLADPRNLGAVVRAARAFGADLVVSDVRGADPFARQAVRASVGHVFSLPLVTGDVAVIAARLREAVGLRVLAAVLDEDATPLPALRPAARTLLAVGNEGRGLSPGLRALADERVRIPVDPTADSLNVAAAAAVLLYGLGAGRPPV